MFPFRLMSFLLCSSTLVFGWSSSSPLSRRDAFQKVVVATTTATAEACITPLPAIAKANGDDKLYNLSNEALAEILTKDVVERQFLCNGDITRQVYDESATFTDEIDTYQLDQWVKGTKRLFVADKSQVTLEPNSMKVSDLEASFRFSEYLMFNIPFKPTVYLSGKVVFQRDPKTGLITSYQEQWDQSVNSVLKSAKFGK